MDDAERWLRDNDPDYDRASRDWRHVKTGEYKTPRQEVPVGLYHEDVVYVVPVETRACEGCGGAFSPRESKHRYCSDACKQRAYRARARRA
jgi:hypothetical protein